MEQIGIITEQVIEILNLDVVAGTPIYLGNTNVAHMISTHEKDYELYGDKIREIISSPTYVGYRKDSIEYIKELSEYVKVAVRVSSDNLYFARTLYVMNSDKVENMVAKGKLFPLT